MGSIRYSHRSKGRFAFRSMLALAALSSFAASESNIAEAAAAPVTVSGKAPIVTFSAVPSTVKAGAASTLTWSSTDATACGAWGGPWSGHKGLSGSQSTGPVSAHTTYWLLCRGPGGSTVKTAAVSVNSSAPAVLISAAPSSVTSGTSTTLTWSATNATACTASGAWSGSKAVSGSQGTAALSADASYQLTCTGAGGSATHTATVSVTHAIPTVNLAASPGTVQTGAKTTLTWSSTNATSCTASGGWLGSRATSGSSTTGALNTTTIYALACTGAEGTANKTATVTVTAALNGTATLSWKAPTTNTDGTPVTPLSGYTIYYGTSPSALSHSIPASATATSYEITGLAPGTWYFAVAADAKVGTQSAMSNIGSKTD
jgi:Fibronectin type III domain